jgi:hypothetical protein
LSIWVLRWQLRKWRFLNFSIVEKTLLTSNATKAAVVVIDDRSNTKMSKRQVLHFVMMRG